MKTVELHPDAILVEGGEMVAVWPIVGAAGQVKAIIPRPFAPMVEQAKSQNRRLRLYYQVTLGRVEVRDVQLKTRDILL